MKVDKPQVLDQIGFKEKAALRCPCGGTVRVGFAGKDGEGEPIVAHSVPECRDLHERDVVGFLRWLRDNGAEVLS